MTKKLALVNGFKVPEEWYALVQRVAEERNTSIGAAIQYVFNLGLPLYHKVRAAELETIARAREEAPAIIRTQRKRINERRPL